MEQYHDGSFGDIKAVDELFENLFKDRTHVKAIHFGTRAQLEEVKTLKCLEDRVSELEEQVKPLVMKEQVKGLIHIPDAEARRILGIDYERNPNTG